MGVCIHDSRVVGTPLRTISRIICRFICSPRNFGNANNATRLQNEGLRFTTSNLLHYRVTLFGVGVFELHFLFCFPENRRTLPHFALTLPPPPLSWKQKLWMSKLLMNFPHRFLSLKRVGVFAVRNYSVEMFPNFVVGNLMHMIWGKLIQFPILLLI